MNYIKPHLSPELRAQIAPSSRRDRRLALAGVVFLLLSVVLTINLVPRGTKKLNPTNQASLQTSTVMGEKQVLGVSTQEEQPAVAAAQEEFTSYSVKQGDTLFNISQQYNVRWDLIAQMNGLTEPYMLKPGQSLKIPQATTSKVPGKIYTILEGDTLSSVAKQYNITVADIVAVNPNLQKSELVTTGQVIKLP